MNLVPLGVMPFVFNLAVLALLAGGFWLVHLLTPPAKWRPRLLLALTVPVVVLQLVLIVPLLRRAADIQDGNLVVKTWLHTVTTPVAHIAHVNTGDACRPHFTLRTNGIGMPGYAAGWFRGPNGEGFVDVVSGANLCIHPKEGPEIVLEVQDPAAFREALVRHGFVDAAPGVGGAAAASAPGAVHGGAQADDHAHPHAATVAGKAVAAAAGAQAAAPGGPAPAGSEASTGAATQAAPKAIAAPKRLVVMGGTLTEIVYALGAGEQVVGVDQSSLYPPQARQLPQVGYFRQFSVEGVVALKPDLVIAAAESGPPPALDKLRALGVSMELLELKPDTDSLTSRITELATLLGRKEQGQALVARIRQQVADATRQKHPLRVLALSSHAGKLQGAGRGTAADALLGMVGATNVLAGTHQGYKQLSPEAVAALQPDVILTSSLSVGKAGPAAFLAQPGIVTTPAARRQQIVVLGDLLLLGFGPRVGEALQALADGLARARPAGTEAN